MKNLTNKLTVEKKSVLLVTVIAMGLVSVCYVFIKGLDPVNAAKALLSGMYSENGFRMIHSLLLTSGAIFLALKVPFIKKRLEAKENSSEGLVANTQNFFTGLLIITLVAEAGGGLYTNIGVTMLALLVVIPVTLVSLSISAVAKKKIKVAFSSPLTFIKAKIEVKSILQVLFVVAIVAMTAFIAHFINLSGKLEDSNGIAQLFYGAMIFVTFICALIIAASVFSEDTKDENTRTIIAVCSSGIILIFLICLLTALL